MKTSRTLGVMALIATAASAFAAGTPPALPRVKDLTALRREVRDWGEHNGPRLSDQDVEALVDWLNRNFYRLEA